MSVKEVVQSLVDDDMVDSERIGTSTYFWAFPSKASMKVNYKLYSIWCVSAGHKSVILHLAYLYTYTMLSGTNKHE